MKSITEVLAANEQRQGTIKSSSDQLRDLCAAVRESGKAGSITIKLTVSPDKHDENALQFDADVTAKLPKRKVKPTIMFFDERTGDLSREDPRQIEMQMDRGGKVASIRGGE